MGVDRVELFIPPPGRSCSAVWDGSFLIHPTVAGRLFVTDPRVQVEKAGSAVLVEFASWHDWKTIASQIGYSTVRCACTSQSGPVPSITLSLLSVPLATPCPQICICNCVEKQKDKVPPCTLGLRKKIKSFYGGECISSIWDWIKGNDQDDVIWYRFNACAFPLFSIISLFNPLWSKQSDVIISLQEHTKPSSV